MENKQIIKSQNQRNFALDLLRIFSCYCVIMIHVSGELGYSSLHWRLVQGIVRPALWCFLVLSGYFILSRPIENWAKFYFTHLLHLIVPLFVYIFIYQLYYNKSISFSAIVRGDSIGHLWYVYSLISLYIIAPFLQKMLINLKNKQIISLLVLMFFGGRIMKILEALGFVIGVPTALFEDCMLFFFILGYLLSQVQINISCKITIPLGIVNILYSSYTFSNPVLVNGAANLALSMVVGCLIYYMIFTAIFAHENIHTVLLKTAQFLSKRTYGIYLIHLLIIQYFAAKSILVFPPDSTANIWLLPLKCLVIFLIGLAISIIIDLLICEPAQKICNYLYQKISLQFDAMRKEK